MTSKLELENVSESSGGDGGDGSIKSDEMETWGVPKFQRKRIK